MKIRCIKIRAKLFPFFIFIIFSPPHPNSSPNTFELEERRKLILPSVYFLFVLYTHMFIFEATLPGYADDDTDVQVRSEHKTAKQAAQAAWKVCEDYDLEMPSSDWYTDTGRYGSQEVYNVMVPAGHDWECDKVFIQYMTRHAQKRTVVLEGPSGEEICIYSEK